MSSEVEQILRYRRRYLIGICSAQMVNTILYAPGTEKDKQIRFDKAKKIAKSKGRERVFLEDWNEAKS